LLKLAEESPTSEERRMYLRALSAVLDPELAQRSAEFFTSRHVAPGDGGRALEEEAWEHPDIVWTHATTHLKQMQQRFGFFRWNRLLPSLAAASIDTERADELVRFAKQNLPAQGQREADNAANLIRFRADLKKRELPKIDQWIATKFAQVSARD
jgi:aminopeptidase N